MESTLLAKWVATSTNVYIQMRMLNTGKGPAVRAFTCAKDRHLYAQEMKKTIEKQKNLIYAKGFIWKNLICKDRRAGVVALSRIR